MPKPKNAIRSIPAVDLAYAVDRLVAARKTTAAEVLALAAERGKRIALLEAELTVLRQGGAVAAPEGRPARPAAKRVRKAAPKAAAGAPGSLATFRKLQGKYMGLLRNFAGPARDRIKAIAKAQKFPAAIAEMKKLLAGKGGAAPAAKSAPAKRAASAPAPRKLQMSPKRRAQLKLQGEYIGLLRGLAEGAKSRIKAMAREKGFAAAIEAMKKGAGK